MNDLSHNNDDIASHNAISDQNAAVSDLIAAIPDLNAIKDKLDVVQIEEDIIEEIKLNVDNDDIFKKYKPTTTTPGDVKENKITKIN